MSERATLYFLGGYVERHACQALRRIVCGKQLLPACWAGSVCVGAGASRNGELAAVRRDARGLGRPACLFFGLSPGSRPGSRVRIRRNGGVVVRIIGARPIAEGPCRTGCRCGGPPCGAESARPAATAPDAMRPHAGGRPPVFSFALPDASPAGADRRIARRLMGAPPWGGRPPRGGGGLLARAGPRAGGAPARAPRREPADGASLRIQSWHSIPTIHAI